MVLANGAARLGVGSRRGGRPRGRASSLERAQLGKEEQSVKGTKDSRTLVRTGASARKDAAAVVQSRPGDGHRAADDVPTSAAL